MLEIKDLSFLDIIEDINVTFENGHVYLITGENGCGKTVFFKCILGLLKKTTGTVLVDGISVDSNPKLKKQLGALVEDPDFLSWNSGIDNLRYLASINGKMNEELVYDLLKKLSLYEDRNKITRKYSLGMKKKLGIIQAIMEDQKIILFDEPTNGLDDASVLAFYDIVKELKKQGKTILVVSHKEDDMKNIADMVYVMEDGNLNGSEVITSDLEQN